MRTLVTWLAVAIVSLVVIGLVIGKAELRQSDPAAPTQPSQPQQSIVGVVSSTCAPWDGPAETVTLSTTSTGEFPQLSVSIWQTELPSSFSFDPTINHGSNPSGGGWVSFCERQGSCDAPQAAEFAFTTTADGATGTYDAVLPDGNRVNGTFSAVRETRFELCG